MSLVDSEVVVLGAAGPDVLDLGMLELRLPSTRRAEAAAAASVWACRYT